MRHFAAEDVVGTSGAGEAVEGEATEAPPRAAAMAASARDADLALLIGVRVGGVFRIWG